MGFIDDAKQVAGQATENVKRGIQDAADRVSDKADEAQADAEVKKAEVERDRIEKRNEAKEALRD